MSDFRNFNISRRKRCFQLKFSGHSTHQYISLWAKSQVEIPPFDLSVYTIPQAKTPVKCLQLWTERLWALILLGLFIPHWGLPYAHSPNSKAIRQLGRFPRKSLLPIGHQSSHVCKLCRFQKTRNSKVFKEIIPVHSVPWMQASQRSVFSKY